MDNTDKPLHWTNVGWSSKRDLSILKRGILRLRDFLNREEKPSRHVSMVAKFLVLNKPWPCKFGRKNENIGMYGFPVHDCTREQNGSPCFYLCTLNYLCLFELIAGADQLRIIIFSSFIFYYLFTYQRQ